MDPFTIELEAYARADRLYPPPKDPVLFYGGSSIRCWPLLEYDFAQFPVLNRGFGGARLQDCLRLFTRLVTPYAPRVIVFYAGDNDLVDGCDPSDILANLRKFVDLVWHYFPSVPIAYISIKPSPSRLDLRDKLEEANHLVESFASTQPQLTYVDIYNRMLETDGNYSCKWFLDDSLHMNRTGYDLWRDILTPYLHEVYKNATPPTRCCSEAGLRREHHHWYSPYLGRQMELIMFGHGGTRMLVFPTLHGRFYQYEINGMVEALRDRLLDGKLQLFCVDSVDIESFYNGAISPRERIIRYRDFETYIILEVLPFSERINRNPSVMVHGCSLGAFHAVNIAFRHPSLFSGVLALSGRYNLTEGFIGFPDLFDGYYDEDVYFNTPNHFLQNLTDRELLEQLRKLKITLAVGESDTFLESNRQLSNVLEHRNVPHALHVWNGIAHDFSEWRKMVKIYA